MSESVAQIFVRGHNGWTLAFDRKTLRRGQEYAEDGRSEIVSILGDAIAQAAREFGLPVNG